MNYTDLIGVPFVSKGRDMNGMDCYGLVKEVYKRHGHNIPEYDSQYKDFDDTDKIDSLIKGNTLGYPWKEISEPKVPCLIAIRFGTPDGVVNHTAVYIGNGQFIHTRAKIGVNIDRISSPAWRHVIVGFYEYVGDK